jgi:hypothetical protein
LNYFHEWLNVTYQKFHQCKTTLLNVNGEKMKLERKIIWSTLGKCKLGFTLHEFWLFKFEKMKWLFLSSQVLPPFPSVIKPAPQHISDFFIGFFLQQLVKVSPSNLSKKSITTYVSALRSFQTPHLQRILFRLFCLLQTRFIVQTKLKSINQKRKFAERIFYFAIFQQVCVFIRYYVTLRPFLSKNHEERNS